MLVQQTALPSKSGTLCLRGFVRARRSLGISLAARDEARGRGEEQHAVGAALAEAGDCQRRARTHTRRGSVRVKCI